MKRTYILPAVAGLLISGLVVLALVHHADLVVFNPQGPIAAQEKWVIITTVLLSAIVVLPLFGLLAWFSYRYRASRSGPKGRHEPDWDHDSAAAEFSWWLVPTAIVIVLSFVAWRSTYALDPFMPLQNTHAPVRIQAVALRWKWLFIYPDLGIATVNQITFPAGTPIHFDVTADAPMNQFWIPSLAGQVMAMPGMSTQLSVIADHPGTYTGLSSHISGEGFAGMTFQAKAVSPQDFNTWVTHVRSSANRLDVESYAGLEKPSTYVSPMYYSSIATGMYTSSMMKYMAYHSRANQSESSTTGQPPSQTMQNMAMPSDDSPALNPISTSTREHAYPI